MLVLAGGLASVSAQQPDPTAFRHSGSIPVDFVPGFLATSLDGKVAITSFNLDGSPSTSAYIVQNPTAEFSPMVFDSEPFPRDTGYSGVTFDSAGAIYLTGDTGDSDTSFLRKYRPDLQRDEVFGINGENRQLVLRALGCTVINDRLFVASTWGTIAVFSSITGRFEAMLSGDSISQIRDLTAETNAQQIFGAGQGALYFWNGGTTSQLGGYQFQRLSEPLYPGSRAEGVAYHAPLRTLYYIRRTPLEVRANNGTNDGRVFSINDVPSISNLCDVAFSADYQVMYVSDPEGRALHYSIFRGAVSPQVPYGGAVGGALSEPIGTGDASALSAEGDLRSRLRSKQTEWYTTLSSIALQSTAQSKKMGIYFRNDRSTKCAELEADLLTEESLFSRYTGVLWAKLDVSQSATVAEDLGVFRVPTLLLYDEEGDVLAQLEGDDITEARIRRALNQ